MLTDLEIQAIGLLQQEVERGNRTKGLPLAPSFVRSADPDSPPALARLVGAGRAGDVRLKLFLTFALRAARGRPTLAARRSSTLARMLALPPKTGARRVTDAMRWLKDNHFLILETRVGQPGELTLLNGEDPPADLSARDKNGYYVQVPVELWTSGHILTLRARELGVFIALQDLTSNSAREGSMTGFRKRQYGISDDSWTRALKVLKDRRLITYRSEIDEGEDRVPRRRQVYERVLAANWNGFDGGPA
jgi:hypothetical protein